jgi:hypothetical protein
VAETESGQTDIQDSLTQKKCHGRTVDFTHKS